MSAATSPGTGLAYGLQRVCAAWGFARSSFYAMKSRQQATAERPPAKRRGPKPSISDEALLVAIEADLEASPWEGEGHRKVWARLRVCRGIRVSRKRVLRVMRENNLLSPHRCRRRGGNPHVGEIITHAPNLMWGTDGVRVFTVDDGWGWIFTAIEHWNAECVGWHVCKRGDRFAALQPISMGLARLYASTSAGAARGLALRMDPLGSQYLSDHFSLREPDQVLGHPAVLRLRRTAPDQRRAERFNRTLKEQIGRIYRNIAAAERRPRVRRTVQCPVDRGEERLPEPRSSSSGVAHRDVTQARRMRQTCVQGTGCDTSGPRGVTHPMSGISRGGHMEDFLHASIRPLGFATLDARGGSSGPAVQGIFIGGISLSPRLKLEAIHDHGIVEPRHARPAPVQFRRDHRHAREPGRGRLQFPFCGQPLGQPAHAPRDPSDAPLDGAVSTR